MATSVFSAPVRPVARARRWAGVALLLTLQASCFAGRTTAVSGAAGDGNAVQNANDANAPTGTSNDHLPQASACIDGALPPQAVRRLTRLEINNSVVDLLADANAPQTTDLFAGDGLRYGFDDVQEALSVNDTSAFMLALYAESVGTYAAAKAAALWPACATADANCFGSFVDGFGARAYRRPLSADERAGLLALVANGNDFATGIGTLVAAMLQSPGFLYRTELGTLNANHQTYRLTPYEVASELSYTYTASMPDATLLAAAASGQLATTAQLEAQAKRLLGTARARVAAQTFFLQWSQVSQLTLTTRSEGTTVLADAVKRDMQQELRSLVDDVVFDAPGSVRDLYTRDKTTLPANLASYYGVAAGATTASALGRTPGLLGLGGLLAVSAQPTYASPTLRGRLVRMRLLCGSVPVPPAGVPPLGEASGATTLRQRLSAHASLPSCVACHAQLDPLGFVLGGYDTIGRLRAGGLENGQPVDTLATVVPNMGQTGADVAVAGPGDLAAYLAQSEVAQDCLVRHWAMYSFGRIGWAQDACTYAAAAAQTRKGAGTVQNALLSLVYTPGFLARSAGI